MISPVEGGAEYRHRAGLENGPDCTAVKGEEIAVPGPGAFREDNRTVPPGRSLREPQKLPHCFPDISFPAYESMVLETELGGHKGDPVGEFLLGDKPQALPVKRRNQNSNVDKTLMVAYEQKIFRQPCEGRGSTLEFHTCKCPCNGEESFCILRDFPVDMFPRKGQA